VCAQALCLEEMRGKAVAEGYVYYAQSHQRVLVELTEELRQDAIATIAQVRSLLTTGVMPKPVYTPRCKGCSLYAKCLPRVRETLARYREA
jgi:CRISPR-associated exonuclease Cas4